MAARNLIFYLKDINWETLLFSEFLIDDGQLLAGSMLNIDDPTKYQKASTFSLPDIIILKRSKGTGKFTIEPASS